MRNRLQQLVYSKKYYRFCNKSLPTCLQFYPDIISSAEMMTSEAFSFVLWRRGGGRILRKMYLMVCCMLVEEDEAFVLETTSENMEHRTWRKL